MSFYNLLLKQLRITKLIYFLFFRFFSISPPSHPPSLYWNNLKNYGKLWINALLIMRLHCHHVQEEFSKGFVFKLCLDFANSIWKIFCKTRWMDKWLLSLNWFLTIFNYVGDSNSDDFERGKCIWWLIDLERVKRGRCSPERDKKHIERQRRKEREKKELFSKFLIIFNKRPQKDIVLLHF